MNPTKPQTEQLKLTLEMKPAPIAMHGDFPRITPASMPPRRRRESAFTRYHGQMFAPAVQPVRNDAAA